MSGVHNSTASRSTAANNTDSDWSVNNSTAPMNTGSDWPVNNSTEPYNTASDSDDSSESQSSDSGWTDPENSTLSQSTDTDWNTISTVNPPTDAPDPTTTPRPVSACVRALIQKNLSSLHKSFELLIDFKFCGQKY